MDISAAFLKGMTFQEIASEAGDNLRSVQFDFPPADAWIFQWQSQCRWEGCQCQCFSCWRRSGMGVRRN
eukprot:6218779-Prorocentrum_lima.AAC.1